MLAQKSFAYVSAHLLRHGVLMFLGENCAETKTNKLLSVTATIKEIFMQ